MFLPLLVGPVIGTHVRLDDQLVSFARVARQSLAERTEGDEPQTGGDLAGGTAFVLAGVVVPYQAEARVARLVLGDELRVTGEVADRGEIEAVHVGWSSSDAHARVGRSLVTAPTNGIAIDCLFVQKRAGRSARSERALRDLCMVGGGR